MMRPHRNHPLWYAFLAHRISGVLLALFLPVHFYVLSLAMTQPDWFNSAIEWTDQPFVKVAEFGLVFLLGVHFFGGLRLLALEFLPWSNRQKTYAALAVSLSFVVSGSFLLNAVGF